MSYKILEEYINGTVDTERRFIAKFLLEFCQFSENKKQYEEMLSFMFQNGTVSEVLDMFKLVKNKDVNIVELYYIDENKDEILMSKFTIGKYNQITEELKKLTNP
jgi:hypothetical protein